MPIRKKKFTCIVCPLSCIIDVNYTNKGIKKLKGHQCKKGKSYVEAELYAPMRTLTTTVLVRNGVLPVVSVRTDKPIPKNLIFSIMDEIMGLKVEAPIKLGDMIYKNIKDTGANIIATKTVGKIYK